MESNRDNMTQPAGSSQPSDGSISKQDANSKIVLNGRYLIEKELGRGGIGIVYLACDQQVNSRPVVIKVLIEQQAQNEWVKKKFHQEIQALARINHPGVVGVLD